MRINRKKNEAISLKQSTFGSTEHFLAGVEMGAKGSIAYCAKLASTSVTFGSTLKDRKSFSDKYELLEFACKC